MFASELWIIYALIFAAVILAVQGLYLFLFRGRSERKQINRRLALSEQLRNQSEVLDALRRERGFGGAEKIPALRALSEFLIQTGLRIDGSRIALWLLVPAVLLFILYSFALGVGPLSLIAALISAFLGVLLVLSYIRRARIARFTGQLPDALDVIVRGLRAGHPFRSAVGLASREMPDPIGTEFGIVLDEITFGLDLNSAINNLYRRVGQEDLSFFAVAVNVQSQTGGNLAEILGRLSQLLRNRAKMHLKVRALTAEGRASAIALSLVPFILFLVINLISPSYFWDVRNHPAIVPVAMIGLLLLVSGNFILYRMVHFKV